MADAFCIPQVGNSLLNDYHFHEGELPSGYTFGFEVTLFNQPGHLQLQASENWSSFYILHERNRSVLAVIHFHLSEDVAKSPLRGPFGSIEFSKQLPERVLFQFIKFFERRLHQKGVRSISIRNRPQAHLPPQMAILNVLLLNHGYQTTASGISSIIEVKALRARDNFHRSEKRKLLKAIHAGLIFRQLELTQLNEVYQMIHTCRAEKGYELSMSLAALQRTVTKFPDRYFLFAVFDYDKLVAASVTIKVSDNILYDFYHDHLASFNHLSPVVMLVDGMYDFCLKNGIALFDLGTSSVNGRPNFGLLHFKKFLGGKPTAKLTFEKELNDE